MSGRTFAEMFPTYRALVFGDGYVDHITGPRCIVQMLDGPQQGLDFIAHTDEVLSDGTPVNVQTIWRMHAKASSSN